MPRLSWSWVRTSPSTLLFLRTGHTGERKPAGQLPDGHHMTSGADDVWFAAAFSVLVTLGLAALLKLLLSKTAICIAGRTC